MGIYLNVIQKMPIRAKSKVLCPVFVVVVLKYIWFFM